MRVVAVHDLHGRSADARGKNAEANTRRTQLSTPRPRIEADRIATHSTPQAATISSTRALSSPSAKRPELMCFLLGPGRGSPP